jgi:hypothetical protein
MHHIEARLDGFRLLAEAAGLEIESQDDSHPAAEELFDAAS